MFQSFFTSEGLLTFDMNIYKFAEMLKDHGGKVLDEIMIFCTHLGDSGIFWIALAVVLLIFKKTRKLGLAAMGGIVLVSFMNSIVLKDLFERARPYIMDPSYWEKVATDGWQYNMPFESLKEKSFSFPSGHTATSFGAAIGIFYIDKKKGIAPLILAFLIGFSRIYIHVHYPSDVIGGMIVGIVFGLVACLIIFKLCGGLLDKINAKCKYKLFDSPIKAGAAAAEQPAEAVEAQAEHEIVTAEDEENETPPAEKLKTEDDE